jgi:hypothetical protein
MKYRVWWVPQVPMKNPFLVSTPTLGEAIRLYDTLARYDEYQYANNIKPDYANAGGIDVSDETFPGGWVDWHDSNDYSISGALREIEGEDAFRQYIEEQESFVEPASLSPLPEERRM